MKLIWTEPAIADRLAIYEWLELKNPAAGGLRHSHPRSPSCSFSAFK